MRAPEPEKRLTAEFAESAEVGRGDGNLRQRHKDTKEEGKSKRSVEKSRSPFPQVTNHKSQITVPPTSTPTHLRPRAVILCGELSGEVYAAGLTRELVSGGMEVFAMGGERCRRAGAEIIRDYSDLSVVGITEVIENLGHLKEAMGQLIDKIKELQPDVLVCIDFPDFNIRIARKVRKYVGKLIYFVPPQIWAWRRYRSRMLSQLFDRIFVLFPFEVPLFDNGEFHGHPLAEQVKPEIPESDFLAHYGLPGGRKRVLFLPGSRKREYRALMPVLLDTATRLRARWPDASLMLLPSPAMPVDEANVACSALSPVTVIEPVHKYAAMAVAGLAVGASGTVTLECGLSGTPMAVLYKLNPVTTAVGMLAVVSRFISIPNVVLDEAVMGELVNRDCNPGEILRFAEGIFESDGVAELKKRRLAELKQRLYREGSYHRVAERILELL